MILNNSGIVHCATRTRGREETAMNMQELLTYVEELTFKTSMFGYDKDEVDIQLDKICDEAEAIILAKEKEIEELKKESKTALGIAAAATGKTMEELEKDTQEDIVETEEQPEEAKNPEEGIHIQEEGSETVTTESPISTVAVANADEAQDGVEAIEKVKTTHYDCVILDVMMPTLDGFSACKEIKKIQDVPIIMLSARCEEYDKLYAFDLGIDDYVIKPFSPKELMARVKVVLERGSHREKNTLSYEGLVVDLLGRTVSVDGERVTLTPKEIDLLIYLMNNKNIALSRQQLLEEVWNYDYFGDDRTVDTHIKMLRHNIGAYRDHIVTVRGMGYKFEA